MTYSWAQDGGCDTRNDTFLSKLFALLSYGSLWKESTSSRRIMTRSLVHANRPVKLIRRRGEPRDTGSVLGFGKTAPGGPLAPFWGKGGLPHRDEA